MTTRLEKIEKTKEDLKKAPTNVIDFRLNVVDAIELYEDVFDELCGHFRPTTTENNSFIYGFDNGNDHNLPLVANTLGVIRATCLGASGTDVMNFPFHGSSGFKKNENFEFPILVDTSTNKPKFAVSIKDPNFNYEITLNNTSGSTTTQVETDGTSNTFSNYVGDYYFVRSRETGRLLDIVANTTPYVTPSTDVPFGTAVPFGSDSSSESGNWNENFAFANIESISINTYLDQFINIAHTMENGSDSSIPVKAPVLKEMLPLKRHKTDFETITITANTTASSNNFTTDDGNLLKIGSELSSPTFSENVSVTMIDTNTGTVFLDKQLKSTETNLSITSKQSKTGREEHSVFAYATVVADGMVSRNAWKPIGDDDADYSGTNETPDEATEMIQSVFNTKLGDFVPEIARTSENIIFKSTSDLISTGNETASNTYGEVELNPFYPAIQGAGQAYDSSNDQGGRQPSGLGTADIFAGRFVAYEEDRRNNSGTQIGDYRYIVDFASKFFYLVNPLTDAHANTANKPVPTTLNVSGTRGIEPLATFANGNTTILTSALERTKTALQVVNNNNVVTLTNSGGGTPGSIPTGYNRQGTNVWGTNGSNTAVGEALTGGNVPGNYTFYTKSGTGGHSNSGSGTIFKHTFSFSQSPISESESWTKTWSYSISGTGGQPTVDCAHNDLVNIKSGSSSISGWLTENSGDYNFSKGKIDTLKTLSTYKDPITEDSANQSYSWSEYSATLAGEQNTFESAMDTAGTQFGNVNNSTIDGNPSGVQFSKTHINTLINNIDTIKTAITNRITQLNTRLGTPTFTGSQASGGNLPAIRVSAIPGKSAGTLIPYGRSIYEVVNLLLGDDVGLLSTILEEAENLDQSYKTIRDDRNTYDILNGRSKYYGS